MKGKSRLQQETNAADVPRPSVAPASNAHNGPAHHVWDGRLLDEREQSEHHPSNTRLKNQGGPNKDASDVHQGQPMKVGIKFSGQALSHGKAAEQPPMTPPRISGVSLAPLPGPDCLAAAVAPEVASDALSNQRRGPQPKTLDMTQDGTAAGSIPKPVRRPPAIRVAALNSGPQPTLSFGTHAAPRAAPDAAGAAARGDAQGPQGKAPEMPQLVAEGRAVASIMRHTYCPPDSPDSTDANIANYREINDADSLCGTPPISLQSLRKDFDRNLPLGPLTHSPLSPSMLTLCGGLDALDLRPDTSNSFSPKSGPQASLWDSSLSDLPDMRTLRECMSPEMCETPKVPE